MAGFCALVGPIACTRLPTVSSMFLRHPHICYLTLCLFNDVQDHLIMTNESARIAVVEQSNHVTSCLITISFSDQDSCLDCGHNLKNTCTVNSS